MGLTTLRVPPITLGPRSRFYRRSFASKCCPPTAPGPRSPSSSYAIRAATWADHRRLMGFLRRTFLRTEPSLVNIGLGGRPGPDYKPEKDPLCHELYRAVRRGMTLMAVCPRDSPVGAVVNVASSPRDVQELCDRAAKSDCRRIRELYRFYAYALEQADVWGRMGDDWVFEIQSLAVHPRYQGLGIARALMEESYMLARDLGFKTLRVDASSRVTESLCESYGWSRAFHIAYADYCIDGERIFTNIRPPHLNFTVYTSYIDRHHVYPQTIASRRGKPPSPDPKNKTT